jgi:magnesium transporter
MEAKPKPPIEVELANEEAIEPGTPESPGRLHAYARNPRGVHSIPLPEAIQRIASATRLQLPAYEQNPSNFVWVDVVGPGESEIQLLRDQLGFHHLAVDDCIRGRQRPKLQRYPGHFFLVTYAAHINAERRRVAFNELHMFIGDGFIVTVRDYRIAEVRETITRWRTNPDHYRTVGAIAHGLLDAIIDDYFPMIDFFADRVTAAETALLDQTNEAAALDIHELRRGLILFRRVVAPERDIIARLVRRDLPFLSPELVPYFQDIRDHTVRIVEEIDTLRDLIGTTLEGHASASAHQLNQTMRRMAAWSIILMSMNLVASNYGMNFEFMPELHWPLGYLGAVSAMLFVGGLLFAYFWRKRWL